MKRVMVVIAAAFLATSLISCAGNRSAMNRSTAKITSASPAKYFVPVQKVGWVPVDIQNPSLLDQEVYVFEGSTRVELIPDAEKGGWMFSRPPFAYFKVRGANSKNNWHEYERLMLPRNSEFVFASQTFNAWGAGWPEFYGLRTGSDPGVYQYRMVTPSNPSAYCAGLITLREKAVSPFGDGPMRLERTIDLRSLGRGIVGSLIGR